MINKLMLCALLSLFFLTGCGEKAKTPDVVAAEFWQAVIDKDMETAKILTSWNTVDYLRYIQSGKLSPARFELGKVIPSDSRAVIETILYSQSQGQSSIRIPSETVLIKTEQGWRVDLKETIGSTIKETVGTVLDQLNGLMKQGLKGLDQELSNSMKEVEEALKQGMDEFQKELSKPLFNEGLDMKSEPAAVEEQLI